MFLFAAKLVMFLLCGSKSHLGVRGWTCYTEEYVYIRALLLSGLYGHFSGKTHLNLVLLSKEALE